MKHDKLKRIIALALLGSLVLGLLPLAALATETESGTDVITGNHEKASIGIIGGADGPTAIFVTGNWLSTLLLIAGGICGLIAIVTILKKRKK